MSLSCQSSLWVKDWEGMLAAVLETSHRTVTKERFPVISSPRIEPPFPLRVFVVDDEPVIASTLADILTLHGLNVRPFTNPLEALEVSRTNELDLLISDVSMPKLSGIDLAIRIRAIRPACKVLLLSGQASTSYLLRQAEADGHSFELLTKPVHPTTILDRIGSGKLASPKEGPAW